MLSVKGLTKRFGSLVAVDELTFEVRSGEIFGLLGPNGAGKTTTIRMICGEVPSDSGEISLDDKPLSIGISDYGRVGLCPQEIVIWKRLTCIEQLEFMGVMYGLPRKTARSRGKRLLADLGLEEKAQTLGSDLSGGMCRRLNVALALIQEPQLIVLDEPGAGLDPQSRVLIRDFIRSLAKKTTVLFTTHDMDEAERLCDRVAIIDRGRMLVCDTPAELIRGSGIAVDVEERLAVAGIDPGEIRMRPPSLEDVFLRLTGRTLRS